MTPAELECAERRTKQKWYELVRAEEQGASMQVLERLHGLYMLAVEEYNRCLLDLSPRSDNPSRLSSGNAIHVHQATHDNREGLSLREAG
jgi:hypothetical protein